MAIDLTAYATYWSWLIVAALLAGLEMVAPGVFMIWLAGAAAATGAVTLLAGLPWQFQLVAFAIFAVISLLAGQRWMRRHPIASDDGKLNRGGQRLVGRSAVVCEAIAGGEGRVMVGDGAWIAFGADAPVGTRVRILSIDGTRLFVEPE